MAAGKKGKRREKESGNRKLFKGRLEIARSGVGFVVVDGLDQDIFIQRGHMENALSGDEVRVEVKGYHDSRSKRPEGTIVEVLKRKQTEFSGKIELHPHFAFLIPDSSQMPVDIYIPLHLLAGAAQHDHVVARIIEWTPKTKNPVGEVISILTHESKNEIAMQSIIMESGFPLAFPDDVIEESERMPMQVEDVSKQDLKHRKDMRQVLTMTIDPADAKDFDDAISFQSVGGGWYEVGVHIADVAHYVARDSALDKEAYARATSVYLPDRVLPMLPERLSNNLCSLRPGETKFTFSAIFRINKKGVIKDTWLGKTVTKSDRRFTYEEAQQVIESGSGDYAKEILVLNEMAVSLRSERFKAGAINFSSSEVRFELDADGKPIGIVVKESKAAHQLIEEFMLLANRAVANYVSGVTVKEQPLPFPYRVHDVPNEDKLKVFTVFAARFGVRFDLSSPQAIAKSFNQMLETVSGKPEQHVLEQLGIRTMSKAIYTTDNIGHYGLGFQNYCHFTSPIRRYPDILVHRILLECLEGNPKPYKQLEAMCRHCSDQERKAMEAERAANKYKQVELMAAFVGNDFEAVISGVSAYGFWVETIEYKCEGMVSATDLSEVDNFVYHEHDYALIGVHTGLKFGMGDKVLVKLVAANLDKRQLDFSLVEYKGVKQERSKKRPGGAGKPQAKKGSKKWK